MNTIVGFCTNTGIIIKASDKSPNFDYDYVQIKLDGNHARDTDEGDIMLVSKGDINTILNFRWYLNSGGYPSTYGTFDKEIKFSRPVPCHQILFGNLKKGYVVDHINRNRLDNRRENLRVCTSKQNSYNRKKPKNSNNRFKGVVKTGPKDNPRYTASVTKDGQKYEIKDIPNEVQAAKVHDMIAEQLFGTYAAKNFPDKVR